MIYGLETRYSQARSRLQPILPGVSRQTLPDSTREPWPRTRESMEGVASLYPEPLGNARHSTLLARNPPRKQDRRRHPNIEHKSTTRPQSDRGSQLSKASVGRGSGGSDRLPTPEQWRWNLPG